MAGDSVDEQLDKVIESQLLTPYFMAAIMSLLAILEWLRFYTEMKPNPLLFTFVAVVFVVFATWKMRDGYRNARQLKLGLSGERAVGQYLERFRSKAFVVFHDVPCGDSNIDHLLIGTRGIYTVETKTISKPHRGDPHVSVADGNVYVDGRVMDRNPIVQAKAQARWLYNFFLESGFKKFVQPVIVFPGWFVEPCDMKSVGAWVIEPKALDVFIENCREVLTHDEVRALASTVSSHIRSHISL